MIATQLYLIVTGNYAWLNWLTLIAMVAALSDPVIRALTPFVPWGAPAIFDDQPVLFSVVLVALSVVIVLLSTRPVLNLISPNQAMNASFDPLHLVNTYGAFGSVSRERYEVHRGGHGVCRSGRTGRGRSTSSPASPATCDGARRRSRHTTCGSTGCCGSCRCRRPTPRAG
jgi:hypothetical protein